MTQQNFRQYTSEFIKDMDESERDSITKMLKIPIIQSFMIISLYHNLKTYFPKSIVNNKGDIEMRFRN